MPSSTTYIHTKPESFQSKVMKLGMAALGMKNNIERSMVTNRIDNKAAPLPRSLRRVADVMIVEQDGRKIWTFKPKHNASETVILYLHGGAYIHNVSQYHWRFIKALLLKTNAAVIVPDYPLAPEAQYDKVYDFLERVYQELVMKTDAHNIVLMGDSAGAGLALGYAQQLRNDNKPQPAQVILLCPWLDITVSNPDIAEVEPRDKMLGKKGLVLAGQSYIGTLHPADYRVSPMYGDCSGLGQISLFIGTDDLAIADARKFKGMLENLGIALNYFEYPNMFHDWVVVTSLQEAKHAIEQIAALIDATAGLRADDF